VNLHARLIPALTRGLKNNASSDSGLSSLVNALQEGNHHNYLDDPSSLGHASTVTDGNSILGHIFGSKDVSRNIANYGANQAGLSSTLMKKALPIAVCWKASSMLIKTARCGMTC